MTSSDAPATRFTGSGIEYLDFGDGPHGTVVFAHGDQFFTADMLRRQVAQRFKQIRIEAVHGAGHYPHLERPVELAGLITRFLAASPENTVERTHSRGGMS